MEARWVVKSRYADGKVRLTRFLPKDKAQKQFEKIGEKRPARLLEYEGYCFKVLSMNKKAEDELRKTL